MEALFGDYTSHYQVPCCYLDSSKSKLLTGSFDEFEDNSPSLCVKNCAGNGFMLAGVENGNGCYCGDDMPDER